MSSILYGSEENVRVQQPGLAGGRAVDLQIQAVELLPHLGAALFADLAQVFARSGHAGQNGRFICAIKRKDVSKGGRADLAIFRRRNLTSFKQSKPSSGAGFR